MADDLVVLVDEDDRPLGYRNKEECHVVHDGLLGYHHRGLTVLVHDAQARVLLQHRKHRIFDKVWDLAGSTHPYLRNGSQESYEQAALRCLKTEYYGFEDATVSSSSIAVNYAAIDRANGRFCENEFCRLVLSVHDSNVSHRIENAYGLRWERLPQVLANVRAIPGSYAPWVIDLLRKIQEKKPQELSILFD